MKVLLDSFHLKAWPHFTLLSTELKTRTTLACFLFFLPSFFFFVQLTVDTAHGQLGVNAAIPAVQDTKSEGGSATTRGLQMEGKTAPFWALHVKHSCVTRGRHVMVSKI